MEPKVHGQTLASRVAGQAATPGSAVPIPKDCGRGMAGVAGPYLDSSVPKGGGGEGGRGSCPWTASHKKW